MRIAVLFGTRPEVIKLAPVCHAFEQSSASELVTISSGQHREMVAPLLDWFQLNVTHDLALMRPNQSPQSLLARAIDSLSELLNQISPDALMVQGDTTTALAGALAAYHLKIPVGHVEAGLRTNEFYSPFPEEANRSLISRITSWHFAPTARSANALKKESVPGTIQIVGNTVVDALEWTAKKLGPSSRQDRLVLVTAHRRENFGAPIRDALAGVQELARLFPEVTFVYPIHHNPNVYGVAREILSGVTNIRLVEPLPYPEMIDLLRHASLVISDSGGLQEEAPTFGVPVLILRDSTERPEILEAGLGRLVGTKKDLIVSEGSKVLNQTYDLNASKEAKNPYGDGFASQRILKTIEAALP